MRADSALRTPAAQPGHDLDSLRIHEAARKGGKAGRFFAIVTGGLVILGGFAGGLASWRTQKPAVRVAIAQRSPSGSREILLNASGYVTPRRRATIAAKITGRVTGVFFDEGTRVQEGQLLATLDDSDVKKALDAAKADRESSQAGIADLEVQLKNAEIQLHRAEQLEQAGVLTQELLDNARTTAESLRARIELAKTQVSAAVTRIEEAQQAVANCTIHAPFDGIVVSKDAQVGEMVSPVSAGGGFTRTGIATIVDMKSNEIEVDVNEAYLARVRNQQPVTAVLDAYPDWEIPSRVRTVIPSADRQKATVKVRISFAKLDPRILPDMGIKVTFLGAEPRKPDDAAVAIVPQAALHSEGSQKIVFLVKDARVERRAVTVGGSRGADAEIVTGLMAGDTVVVSGPPNLHEGQAIEISQ